MHCYAIASTFLLAASAVLAVSLQPGQACSGSTAYCLEVESPIILRCSGTSLFPGNCDDNLNEPINGARCVQTSPTAGDARCVANAGPSSAFTVTASSKSYSLVTAKPTSATSYSNGTLTSFTPPVQTATSTSHPISISTALAPAVYAPAAGAALAGLLGFAAAAL